MKNLLVSFDKSFDFAYIFKTFVTKWYYYLTLLVVLLVIVFLFFIRKKTKRNNLTSTQKLVYVSVLASICAIANMFDIPINESLQLSFVATVGLVSGYLLGAGPAFMVCFIGDLIGGIIIPKGPYNPIIGIGTGLWGLIPGLAFEYFKGKDVAKIIVSLLLGFLIVSLGVNTIGYALMYPKYTTLALSFAMLPFKASSVVVNVFISILLVRKFKRILPKSKFHFIEE